MSSLNRSNKGTTKEKIYQKLGYKVLENKNHKYHFSLIPARRSLYSNGNIHNIPLLNTKHNFFKKSFFPWTKTEWNNLDSHLRKSESFSVKTNVLKFI